MIPNIVHFIFISNQPHTDDFLYVFYLAILSAKKVNDPKTIYFYYNWEPTGPWWELSKNYLTLIKIEPPEDIDGIPLIKLPHKTDVIRLEKLIENGGIYLDLDTICCHPWEHLLNNKVVLGKEPGPGVCNAVLMAEKESDFVTYWLLNYYRAFNPHGWNEASCLLPAFLAPEFDVLILPETAFFFPFFNQMDLIFKDDFDINPDLITQHLWCSTGSSGIIKKIGPELIQNHPLTLYSKIVNIVFGEIPRL